MSDLKAKLETTMSHLLDAIDDAIKLHQPERAKQYADAFALLPIFYVLGGRLAPAGLEQGTSLE